MAEVMQYSFVAGELSPLLYGRVDLAKYPSALKKCRNFLVLPQGAAVNRPGSRFIVETKNSGQVRLIPFSFNVSQTYVLEMGFNYCRIVTNGAQLLDGGSPVEFATPYGIQDLNEITFVQSADILTLCHPDHAPRQIRREGAMSWSLSELSLSNDCFQDPNTNQAARMWVTAPTGTVTVKTNFDAFTIDMIGHQIRIDQIDNGDINAWTSFCEVDVGQLLTSDINTYEVIHKQDGALTGNIQPTFTYGTGWDGPNRFNPAYGEVVGVQLEYLHSGYGIALITGITDSRTATATVISRFPETVVDAGSGNTRTWEHTVEPTSGGGQGSQSNFSISGADSADPERFSVQVRQWDDDAGDYVSTVLGTSEYTISGSTLTTSSPVLTGAQSDGSGGTIQVDTFVTITQRVITGTSYKWYLPAWTDGQGYPRAVSYFQERFVFGGSDTFPDRVWMTESGIYNSFLVSNPSIDSDAIALRIAARQVNVIRHILPLNGLIAMTSGSEFLIGSENEALTPSSVFAKAQSYRGCGTPAPIVVGTVGIYIQGDQSKVRSLAYSFESDVYTGDDLTVLAEHLFDGRRVVSWDYSQSPYSMVWAVLDDGRLLSMTFMPEQQVIAWAQHDTDGTYESVCCVREGTIDVAYVSVRRTVEGQTKRYIERIGDRRFDDIRDAFFVDSGLTYDGRKSTRIDVDPGEDPDWSAGSYVAIRADRDMFDESMVGRYIRITGHDGQFAQLEIYNYLDPTLVYTHAVRVVPESCRVTYSYDWEIQAKTLSGLEHLEGKTVSVLADGNAVGSYIVEDGSVTLHNYYGVVHVGLPITAQIETLPFNSAQQMIRTKRKQITKVSLLVKDSRGIETGRSYSDLTYYQTEFAQHKERARLDGWANPITPITGKIDVNLAGSWDDDGTVVVQQKEPLPATILAIIPEVSVGG
ncbi:hypothetical protein F0A16_02735 [Salinicola corii]|uniref:Ubiquitin-activating enzyme E1 FCCH domain-containing protein n=1 Tax=Salinicola corii TaxID=2606937 RepID=A0A640WJL1_9GAMM|nr:hypothetical protein [Salinicola corii]KAA0020722.1 hypothetical protein F0A16_02735 [Salinicola corii]